MKILAALLLVPALCFGQTPPKQWPIIGKTVNLISGQHGDDDAGHRWWAWRYLDDNGFRYNSVIQVLRRDKVVKITPQRPGESAADWANRVWSEHSPLPCSDTAISSICETAATALAQVDPPEPPRFFVSKNGTSATRPVYSLDLKTGTVGALIPSLRAPVLTNGEPTQCACWASGVRKNGTAYCTWVSPAPRADQVTACRAE